MKIKLTLNVQKMKWALDRFGSTVGIDMIIDTDAEEFRLESAAQTYVAVTDVEVTDGELPAVKIVPDEDGFDRRHAHREDLTLRQHVYESLNNANDNGGEGHARDQYRKIPVLQIVTELRSYDAALENVAPETLLPIVKDWVEGKPL